MKSLLLFVFFLPFLLNGCIRPAIDERAPTVREQASVPAPPATPPPATGSTQLYRLLPGKSKALFIAREHYAKPDPWIDNVIGVSPLLTGTIALNPQRPAAVQMSKIDVSLFALDMLNDELEGVLRYTYLESDRFPIASFTPRHYANLPEICTGDEELTFTITGDLAIRNLTETVTFTVTARIEDNLLQGRATTRVPMSRFGVDPPSKVGVSWVEDEVEIEVKFVAAPDQ